MDRKEAADLLDNIIGMIEDSGGRDYDTALKMGIEALTAQPKIIACGQGELVQDGSRLAQDCIDRQAAIDALGGNVIVTSRESAKAVMDYIRGCADRIRSLPSAQPDRGYIEQIRWERDTAIQQLKELGYGLGEKPRTQPDLDEWCYSCSEYDSERHCCPRWNRVIRDALKDMKDAQPEIIRCKDCGYYDPADNDEESDWCHAWGETTEENAFCSYAERREE